MGWKERVFTATDKRSTSPESTERLTWPDWTVCTSESRCFHFSSASTCLSKAKKYFYNKHKEKSKSNYSQMYFVQKIDLVITFRQ